MTTKKDMIEALIEHFYHPIAEDIVPRKDWEKHFGKKDKRYLEAKIIECGIDIQEFARIRKQKLTVAREKVKEEECCQNYYKCKFCHTILEGDYGVDCYDCDGEMCMELIQLTETELEELLEKLNSYTNI